MLFSPSATLFLIVLGWRPEGPFHRCQPGGPSLLSHRQVKENLAAFTSKVKGVRR